ncbi:MAG TPA: flagellar protein FlaG [Steroidobacteraceae bacterium]|nr:flagellar protein FlaG [Steroidobacteraceae bacterium]
MANGVNNVGSPTPNAVAAVHPAAPAGSVAPVPAGPLLPVGGKPAPQAGDPLPAARAAEAAPQLIQLQAAVDGVNRFLRDTQRQILFQVNMKSGQTVVTIVNPATGEVIRQIPSADVLAAAQNLQQAGMPLAGLFIDQRA